MLKPNPTANRAASQRCRIAASALCALLLTLASGAGMADGDHDRARQAVEAGEVLPLRAILERVEREYPGQVVDVELEREHESSAARWIYKVKLLRSGGALIKLKVDARTGAVIGRKERSNAEHEQEQGSHRRGGGGN